MFIDLSTIQIDSNDIRKIFYKRMSMAIINKASGEIGLLQHIQRLDEGSSSVHYCLLLDEFQSIFGSGEFLSVAVEFLRVVASSESLSFIGAGTYKSLDGITEESVPFTSPFSKATFLVMQPFSLREMSEMFGMYKETIDTECIPLKLQTKIADESGGHAASFMILLKVYYELQPATSAWGLVSQQHLKKYMNSTHVKAEKYLMGLNAFKKGRARELIMNELEPWN